MKSNVMPTIVIIDREELKELTKEVKETLATDFRSCEVVKKHKSFGVADLWHCRKKMRNTNRFRRT